MSRLTRFRALFFTAVIACATLLNINVSAHAQDRSQPSANAIANLQREVGHELRLLPRLTVFDNMQYQVQGTTVILTGQVTQPVVKTDAEKAVKGIEGVTAVDNKIEVLPLSPDDVRIRRAEYRAMYGFPGLEVYSTGTQQPIHIVVKGGHVTLYGYVANAMDKQIVQTRALSVAGVFGVDNQLQVAPAA
jgi:hyperosmotically inducible periplasmic protein